MSDKVPSQVSSLGLELLEPLGEGASGVVYRARAREGNLCAVKVLRAGPSLSRLERLRFRREFQLLSQLEHDHVLRVLDFDESVPCFTMELVCGETLDVWFANLSDRSEGEGKVLASLIRVTRQILNALSALHTAGIVHRDLKPANIMVTEGPVAKLMDFGLAHLKARERVTRTGAILGTPLYLAPELLTDSDPDPRVDLYSLGIILYEACGGQLPPPPTRGLLNYLQTLSNWTPRQLCQCNPQVPKWLESLVARLLAKDPAERPASASEVEEHIGSCLEGDGTPDLRPLPRSRQLYEAALVGREREIRHIDRLIASIGSGKSTLLVVTGEPGVGKSRLLQETRRRATALGVAVHHFTCVEGDPTPYALFLPLLRKAWRRLKKSEPNLQELLGPALGLLGRLLPEEAYSLGDLPEVDPRFEQARLYDLVARILSTLRHQPCIFCFDDLQWADEGSLGLLRYISLHFKDQSDDDLYPFSILLLHRSEEVSNGHPLVGVVESMGRAHRTERVELDLLKQDQVSEMAASALGGAALEPALVTYLAQASGGNPLYLIELLRGLLEDEIIQFESERWERVKPEEFPSSRVAPSMAMLLDKRLVKLSEGGRELFQGASVLGKTFGFSILFGMFKERGEDEVFRAFDELHRARLLCERPNQGRDVIAFYHDRFRELVLLELTSVRRRRLHLLAAEAYRESSMEVAQKDDLIIHHLTEGDDLENARAHLQRAAGRATRAYATRRAISYYEQLMELGDSSDGVLESLADLYCLVGQAGRALELYTDLLKNERNPERRVSLEKRKGTALCRLARYPEAMESYLDALRTVGVAVPPSKVGLRLSLCARAAETAWLLLRDPAPSSESDEVTELEDLFELISPMHYLLLAHPLMHMAATDVFLRYFVYSMRTRSAPQMARAMALFALGLTEGPGPNLKLIEKLARRSLELSDTVANPIHQARVFRRAGWCLYVTCDFPGAFDYLCRSVQVSRRVEDLYGRMEAHLFLSVVYFCKGLMGPMVREAEEARKLATIGDEPYYRVMSIVSGCFGKFKMGAVEEAEAELLEAEQWRRDQQGLNSFLEWLLADARGMCHFLKDQRQETEEFYKKAIGYAPTPSFRCEAIFRLSEAYAVFEDWESLDTLLKQSRRSSRVFASHWGKWLHFKARLCAQQGRNDQAAELLRESIEIAHSLGIIVDEGKSLGHLARLQGDGEMLAKAHHILEKECLNRMALRGLGV